MKIMQGRRVLRKFVRTSVFLNAELFGLHRFVCAMPANSIKYATRFRTYIVRNHTTPNCKIWEAARATTAAPTFFK